MILFDKDWETHPTAIIDTQTSNKSFLRLAQLYKHMGVKNNSFILTLLNPELQGVDPYDYNKLTPELCLAIAMECRNNFWYYIREVARVPPLAGTEPVPFNANRGNIAAYWLFFNHITFILIQIRQTGKSISIDQLNAYLLNIRCFNTKINLLTKDDKLRSANLVRLKEIIKLLPDYLCALQKTDVANTEEIVISKLNNRYLGNLATPSEKAALSLGRGLSTGIVQCDELAFLYNNAISIPALLAAGGAVRSFSEELGEPYGTIFTTTAGKKDDRDGRYAYNLVSNAATWSEFLFDCTDLDNLERTILKSIQAPSDGSPKRVMVNCTFSHRQLGYSDEWLRKKIMEAQATGDDANRDFFNKWTSGSLSNPLTVDQLETIKNSEIEDYYTEIDSTTGYSIRWYIPKDKIDEIMAIEETILSVDTSEAGGSDDIAHTLISVRTGEIIAAISINETNILQYIEWLAGFIVKYKKMTTIIESKSTGVPIIDGLLMLLPVKGEDPFKRLYNRCIQDKDEDQERFKEINVPMGRRQKEVYVKYKKTFGFSTSGFGATARSMLYSTILQSVAKLIGDKIKDKKTIDQLTSLESKNNRVDHPVGGHDDHVISLLLGVWLLIRGKNLYFYNIDTSKILADNPIQTKIKQYQNSNEAIEQRRIREEMNIIYEQMLKERDENIYRKLENKLLFYNSKLIMQENESFSIEQLLNNISKEKRFNRLTKNTNVNYTNQHVGNNLYSNSDAFGYR